MRARDHASTGPRFLVVGALAVVIDATVYALVAAVLPQLALAKAIGYFAGALFGYGANWRFTFGARRSAFSELLFVGVYACSLGLNVLVNALVLGLLGREPVGAVVAFLAATGVSTIWNYIGLSTLVFTRGRRVGEAR